LVYDLIFFLWPRYGRRKNENILFRLRKKNIGFIPDHRIDFTLMSKKNEGGIIDVIESPGDVVWGVIYSVTESDIRMLDDYHEYGERFIRKVIKCREFHFPEDFDIFSEENMDIDVEDLLNDPTNYTDTDVVVYTVINKSPHTIHPSIRYLHKIQEAAEENLFPMAYQHILNNFGAVVRQQLNSKALDFFLSIADQMQQDDFKEKVRDTDEFGGAGLVITGSEERKRQLNENYPDDVVVLTNYWKELSWIVLQFYENESTSWLFNYFNKRIYFQDFGKALLAYQKNHPNDIDHIGICQAGITQAYSILTEGGDLYVK
jgi:hypothetical protein